MPAATCRADLIAVTEKEWDKLDKLLRAVPERLAVEKDADGWSIKDVVAHRAHWNGLFFQWLEEGAAAEMPDHGVKWTQLKPYNAGVIDRYDGLVWAEACDRLAAGHARFMTFLRASDDTALYGGPMPGGNGKWTTGRYAEAAGPSHYRSAAKYIRARLRSGSEAG